MRVCALLIVAAVFACYRSSVANFLACVVYRDSMLGVISRNFVREGRCVFPVLRSYLSSSNEGYARVFAWGEGASGQLGNGKTGQPKAEGVAMPTQTYAEKFPVEITQLQPQGGDSSESIVQIAAGGNGSGALTAGGKLYLWGSNSRVCNSLNCRYAPFELILKT